jgi:hypothetical protein
MTDRDYLLVKSLIARNGLSEIIHQLERILASDRNDLVYIKAARKALKNAKFHLDVKPDWER